MLRATYIVFEYREDEDGHGTAGRASASIRGLKSTVNASQSPDLLSGHREGSN